MSPLLTWCICIKSLVDSLIIGLDVNDKYIQFEFINMPLNDNCGLGTQVLKEIDNLKLKKKKKSLAFVECSFQ